MCDGSYRKVEGKSEDNWVWSPQGVIDLHRPEHWGVVQFESSRTARVTRRDAAGKIRELLHRFYYAQRDFRIVHQRWATCLEELDFPNGHEIDLYATPNYFEAVARDESGEEWHIGSDSHFWKGESYESKCVRGECEFRPDFGAANIDF